MKTGPAGLDLIKRNEGCRLTAYQDVVGVLTIGYGDTQNVQPGLRITQQEAEGRLADRLEREFEPGVLAAIAGAPTTQNQFDAMVSLAYNIGVGAFKRSTVARMHKAGDHSAAAGAFGLWNKAGGRILAGLTRRRKEEAELYLRAAMPATKEPLAEIEAAAAAFESAAATLQVALQKHGFYRGDIDGDFGRQSRSALLAYRKLHKRG